MYVKQVEICDDLLKNIERESSKLDIRRSSTSLKNDFFLIVAKS